MSKKDSKFKRVKKVLNNIWKYGTLLAIILVMITGLVIAIKVAYENKQQLVLNALNQYNQKELGYTKNTETESRSIALSVGVGNSIQANKTLVNELNDNGATATLEGYYSLTMIKVRNYNGNIEELINCLEDASIDAWIIETFKGEYYYGNSEEGTLRDTEIEIVNSTAMTFDDLVIELENVLSENKTVIINSDFYGVFYITSNVCTEYNSVKENLEEIDKLLVLIRILKCSFPTSNLDNVIEYYEIIKNN